MRSRTNRINVWLSDEELADLNEKVSRVRGSRERFIRQCINGAAIREAPSVDVPKLIYEVRRVGASLNRILIIANARGLLEVPELRRALERNRELEVRIVDAYTKDCRQKAPHSYTAMRCVHRISFHIPFTRCSPVTLPQVHLVM